MCCKGRGPGGTAPSPPPLNPLLQPQLGLLALPKAQKKGFPPTHTAEEEFFNSLLEVIAPRRSANPHNPLHPHFSRMVSVTLWPK